MNIYINPSWLQWPNWTGTQLYIYRILDEMSNLGQEHTFHLHFGRCGENAQIDALVSKPNVVRHDQPGRIRSQVSVPMGILRTKSRVYYRMFGEDRRMLVPALCPTANLVYDCGRHLLPQYYMKMDDATRKISARYFSTARQHLRSLNLIVTISEAVKNELIELFDLDPERILVACCAIDLPGLEAPEEKLASLPPGVPYFLMVNPGRGYKNWQDAFAAFSLYMASHPDDQKTLLVLAGDLRDQMEPIALALAADPALRSRVLCLGYVSANQLHSLYRHARLAISPSRYEGFGVQAAEALAYDVPLIVSDIPVFREVAGDAALRVPLDQPEAMAIAMNRLNTDTDLRKNLIAAGQRQRENFSWSKSAQKTLDALVALGSR